MVGCCLLIVSFSEGCRRKEVRKGFEELREPRMESKERVRVDRREDRKRAGGPAQQLKN